MVLLLNLNVPEAEMAPPRLVEAIAVLPLMVALLMLVVPPAQTAAPPELKKDAVTYTVLLLNVLSVIFKVPLLALATAPPQRGA